MVKRWNEERLSILFAMKDKRIAEIAEATGMKYFSVYRQLIKQGIYTATKPRLTIEELDSVLAMMLQVDDEGNRLISNVEIAKKIGKAHTTIMALQAEFSKTHKISKTDRYWFDEHDQYLIYLYKNYEGYKKVREEFNKKFTKKQRSQMSINMRIRYLKNL